MQLIHELSVPGRRGLKLPASDVPAAADGFSVGVRVNHPMFGSGKVLGREGSGTSLKLTIQFTGYGTKRILPAYTQLKTEGKVL